MKALVVGCGSIGTRRAKILKGLGHEVWGCDSAWDYASDDPSESRFEAGKEWSSTVGASGFFGELEVALEVFDEPFDVVLICTPPDSGRFSQVATAIKVGTKGVYVEKPLDMNATDADGIGGMAVMHPNVVTMGACNLRFVKGVEELKKMKGAKKHGRFAMGQHAKYWNPDHKPISMALDSIHELDLAIHLLGDVTSIRGNSAETVADLSVHHENGAYSHTVLDRVMDPPTRFCEIFTEGEGGMVDLMKNDGMYEREMKHFMDCVEGGEPTCNPLAQAVKTLLWALEVA